MSGSGTILVLKRDGTAERFDHHKLRGCMLRAMRAADEDTHVGEALARAVGCYLLRRGIRCVSSGAVLEMVLTVLRVAGLDEAKARLEQRHAARLALRGGLRLHHDNGVCTAWSKQWLVQQGRSQWGLGRPTARILAGQVEQALMRRRGRDVSRSDAIRMLARSAAAYGLVTTAPAATAPSRS